MKTILIRKILFLGLIMMTVGCSAEPTVDTDKINRETALAELKGSWEVTRETITTITKSFGSTLLPSVGDPIEIKNLEFSIGKVSFEYIDINIEKGWIIYKATLDNTIMYTAFGISDDGDMLTESDKFSFDKADLTTPTEGELFLNKK